MSSFTSYHGKKFRVRFAPGSNYPPVEWCCIAVCRIGEPDGGEELFLPFETQPDTIAAVVPVRRRTTKRKQPAANSDAQQTNDCGVVLHANRFTGAILPDPQADSDFFVDLTAPTSEMTN